MSRDAMLSGFMCSWRIDYNPFLRLAMNKPLTDFMKQLVSQARLKSDVIAINPIVDKVRSSFPETAVDEIAVLVLKCILASNCKVVWETQGTDLWADLSGDGPITLH